MRCLGLISEQWLPIVGASVISTFLIIASTGWVHQIVRRTVAPHHHHPHNAGGDDEKAVWSFKNKYRKVLIVFVSIGINFN